MSEESYETKAELAGNMTGMSNETTEMLMTAGKVYDVKLEYFPVNNSTSPDEASAYNSSMGSATEVEAVAETTSSSEAISSDEASTEDGISEEEVTEVVNYCGSTAPSTATSLSDAAAQTCVPPPADLETL